MVMGADQIHKATIALAFDRDNCSIYTPCIESSAHCHCRFFLVDLSCKQNTFRDHNGDTSFTAPHGN
jgi:hypothetical protein